MPLQVFGKDALVRAARSAKLPVAFLVGAPLSTDSTGGVPGVGPMLDLVREEVLATDPAALTSLEDEIRGRAGTGAYQAALGWLQANFTQDAVNSVVRKAVLRARKPGTATGFEGDGIPSEWYIPAGVKHLAKLTCEQYDRFPGPILSTNFDPLISLAIREAGGHVMRRVIDADGGLARDAETDPGVSQVVHLHGYWRDSDTLHTPAQLTGARPRLQASLQRLLQQRTLIVAAYGGWDDVFATALAALLDDGEAKLTVLWCFRESDPALIEAYYGRLLTRVAPAIIRGRFSAYGGIDCHSIFGEIAGYKAEPTATTPTRALPLVGWAPIDATYLGALPPLSSEEVVRYFDGAIPTWRHAISSAIPRRQIVGALLARLNAIRPSGGDCSLQLIRAAGGEGKSTLLLQFAADAPRSGDWTVLWRPSPTIGLFAEHILKLDVGTQWLLVADEAENLIRELRECARILHEAGRSNIHFVLATRDADWRAAGGDRQAFESRLRVQAPIVLRGMIRQDAEAIVEAWAQYGSSGLRELTRLSNTDERAEVLVRAVEDASRDRSEGSLFGGLLAVRFGADGLQAHVRDFLMRLRDVKIEETDYSLFDALIYVAACHAVGIPGLDENVLADLLSVPRHWVQTRIVRPLGEEALAIRSAGHVFTRHRKVAAAVIVEAEMSLGVDLPEIWSSLVRRTVISGRQIRMGRQSYSNIIHAGPRLQRNLPQQLSEERRKEIAIEAAKAAGAVLPERLDCVVDLGKTYRVAADPAEAVRVFRENLSGAPSKTDFADVIRGYWYEWSVCEGERGPDCQYALGNAWLGGISLSDHLKRAPITEEDAKLICAGLGVAFGRLAEARANCPFALGRRAAAYLGRLTNPDPKTAEFFKKYDREADRISTPRPANVGEAISWLAAAVAEAGRQVQDPFLKRLVRPEQVSFTMLSRFFDAS